MTRTEFSIILDGKQHSRILSIFKLYMVLVAVSVSVAATGWRRRGCRCWASRSATAPRDATRDTDAYNQSSIISLNGQGV